LVYFAEKKEMFGFFKKKQEEINIDFSKIGVDFHSHLVPSVDDGVEKIEEAIEIIKYLKSIGYNRIYTSPHIMQEGYVNTKLGLESVFNSHFNAYNQVLPTSLIAEYFVDEAFVKLVAQKDLLTFGQNYILIETSMNYDFPIFNEALFQLQTQGYKPILAHPERYAFIYDEGNYIEKYEELKERGVLFQLNLFALVGLYGQKVQKVAETLIEHNLYDYVSSDIHKVGQLKLFEKLKSSQHLQSLIESGNLKNLDLL
jgi:tyrosine-protein phosphatase YwqE